MRRKECLYAVIGGCVGAILTMAMCSVLPLGGQSQSDGLVFGEIRCTKLIVRGEISCTQLAVVNSDLDRTNVGRGPAVMIMANEKHGGQLYVKGTDLRSDVSVIAGKSGASVSVASAESDVRVIAGKSGASVSVADAEIDTPAAKMGVGGKGGYVWVNHLETRGGLAMMSVDEHGGNVVVGGKGDSQERSGLWA